MLGFKQCPQKLSDCLLEEKKNVVQLVNEVALVFTDELSDKRYELSFHLIDELLVSPFKVEYLIEYTWGFCFQ